MENQLVAKVASKIKLIVHVFDEVGKDITDFSGAPLDELEHEAKAFAGAIFHKDEIRSVCVVDDTGEVKFYMSKTSPREKWVGVQG